ncbi:uncharacterized protein LOC141850750 [Brevipalpus obovatus]|uniref:uncharacterized protein LOC141850750 n=1 Tax=Brevipalpus obovatus TaxID=246614 RepID=UPI003D9F21FB
MLYLALLEMNVLLQPSIITKVFEFLGALDVYRCQYVCKIWRKSAIKVLKKCPPIDRCQSFVRHEYINAYHLDDNAYKQVEKIIQKNRKMDETDCSTWELLDDHQSYYWCIKRTINFHPLSKLEINDAVKNFLTNDARCAPGLSFISFSEDFKQVVPKITFRFPTVLLQQFSMSLFRGTLDPEFDAEIGFKSTALKDDENDILRSCYNHEICSYFDGFHINGYMQGFKTIITDWSDMQSPRPDMEDSEFPIKSVLYLADEYAEHGDRTKTMVKKLQGISKPVIIGGVFYGEWGNSAPILLRYPSKKGLNPARRITIAFAGRRVKSATHIVDSGLKFEKRLEDFKRDLPFPIDNRVIGFLLDTRKLQSNYPKNAILTISKLFARVAIIRIQMKQILQPPEELDLRMILHLVRL